MSTSFSTKIAILAEVHVEADYNSNLEEFAKVCDIGLPLAYLIHQELAEPKGDKALKYIEDTWRMLSESLGIDPNGDYDDAEDFLSHQVDNDEDEDK